MARLMLTLDLSMTPMRRQQRQHRQRPATYRCDSQQARRTRARAKPAPPPIVLSEVQSACLQARSRFNGGEVDEARTLLETALRPLKTVGENEYTDVNGRVARSVRTCEV